MAWLVELSLERVTVWSPEPCQVKVLDCRAGYLLFPGYRDGRSHRI